MVKREDNLPVQVSQQLLRRIISNEFRPGTVLPSEREIGEAYSVSRPIAREAVKILAARGIIAVHPRQGATVGGELTKAAGEALLLALHQANAVQDDLLAMRFLLEPHVAALAAQHATAAQLRRATQLLQTIDTLIAAVQAGDRAQADRLWTPTDQALHINLGEMCQNPVFRIFVEAINTTLWPNRKDNRPPMTDKNMLDGSQQHRAILEAVMARDSAAAEQAMIAHLVYTRDQMAGVFETLHQPVQVFKEDTP